MEKLNSVTPEHVKEILNSAFPAEVSHLLSPSFHEQSINVNGINAPLACYIKAYELGYYIKELDCFLTRHCNDIIHKL